MIYALVYYPNIDTQKINQFRKKYDPQIDLIQPHITLMFPVPESIGKSFLINHIENVLSDWKPFPIHLQGIQKSWDDYLFLMIQDGSANIIGLHSKIYTGGLVDYLKKDLPFVPHLTLGMLTENIDKHPEVVEEAKRLDLDYHCVLDKLNLIKVNDDRSQIIWNKEFSSVR
jgi:2'-5' RNA ligase